MSAHTHGGADDGAGDGWFKILDIVVWVSVIVIFAISAEWLIGYLVRERITAGADKFLAARAEAPSD